MNDKIINGDLKINDEREIKKDTEKKCGYFVKKNFQLF